MWRAVALASGHFAHAEGAAVDHLGAEVVVEAIGAVDVEPAVWYAFSSSSSSSSSGTLGMYTGASGAAERCRDWAGPVPRLGLCAGAGRLRLAPAPGAPPRSRRASAMEGPWWFAW